MVLHAYMDVMSRSVLDACFSHLTRRPSIFAMYM